MIIGEKRDMWCLLAAYNTYIKQFHENSLAKSQTR